MPRFILPRTAAHVSAWIRRAPPSRWGGGGGQKNPFDGNATEETGECSALWGLNPLLHEPPVHSPPLRLTSPPPHPYPLFPSNKVKRGKKALLRRLCETFASVFVPSTTFFLPANALPSSSSPFSGDFSVAARAPFRESWRDESRDVAGNRARGTRVPVGLYN